MTSTSDTSSPSSTKKLPQYFAAFAACGFSLATGTASGWTSPAGPRLTYESEYNFKISEEEFSWVGAVLGLGAASVCILMGYLINWIGKKRSILVLVLPFTLGWLLLIFSPNTVSMIIGRIFLGMASGGICVAAPMYIGEIAEKEVRGMLGTFFQLMMTIGILFVFAVGAAVNVQWLSIICGIIPLISGVCMFFCPESPQHLFNKNDPEGAEKSLKWLRGIDYDTKPEIEEMQKKQDEKNANKVSLKDAMMKRATINAMIISFGLMFFQQMSGINAVIFYTTDIFKNANTGIEPEIATIIVGIMQVVATLFASLLVDRLGRRILLIISAFAMATCTIVMGIYFFLQDKDRALTSSLGWLPITALCIFIIAFSIGFGPVPWLMLGEVFGQDVKGLAGSLSGTLNWVLAFIVTKTYSNLAAAIHTGPTFWFYSVLTIIGAVFVIFVVPETKGKSLNEIQDQLDSGKQKESSGAV